MRGLILVQVSLGALIIKAPNCTLAASSMEELDRGCESIFRFARASHSIRLVGGLLPFIRRSRAKPSSSSADVEQTLTIRP